MIEITPDVWRERLAKPVQAHKYDHGHCVVSAGGFGATGAARLAARAALRVGAGLVTVVAPGEALAECAAQLTAIMLRQADTAPAFGDVLADRRMNSVVVGPGHDSAPGGRSRTRSFATTALSRSQFVVLDADALTCWSDSRRADPGILFHAIDHDAVVLTPHAGEFQTLFPDLDLSERANPEVRAEAVLEAATRSQATVLLKGAITLIGAPDGRVGVHRAVDQRAAPWLATAGSGDVLAGLIAGLGARGWSAFDAACAAVALHVDCALSVGPGLIAEDLPDAVPKVLNAVHDAS